ncbi:MAG: hypothetical protein ACXW0U_07695 [Halobacteriota archaeon]
MSKGLNRRRTTVTPERSIILIAAPIVVDVHHGYIELMKLKFKLISLQLEVLVTSSCHITVKVRANQERTVVR